MLELQGLEKTFLKGTVNAYQALRGIDLTLRDGEFVTVIGSNGAGKSTLFQAISGSFFCDHGKIFLDGNNITWQKEYQRSKCISRIFQDPMKGSAPDLTIEENLALAYARSKKHLYQFAVGQDRALLREKAAALGMGLENRMDTRMGLLSGGQRQAVTLLMATIAHPKVLLLDEHTAALDPLTAERMLALTRHIAAEEHPITLMITHNIAAALSLGTRTIMLESGKIVLDLSGPARAGLDVPGLMQLYREKTGQLLDNDRMLLT